MSCRSLLWTGVAAVLLAGESAAATRVTALTPQDLLVQWDVEGPVSGKMPSVKIENGPGVAQEGHFAVPTGRMRGKTWRGRPKSLDRAFMVQDYFCRFLSPLAPGTRLVVTAPHEKPVTFTYDPETPTPLFKVNQVGYLPDARKYAYLGGWLGDAGPWPRARARTFELVDGPSGRTVLAGKLFGRRNDPHSKSGLPFTGEEVDELDFSSVTNAGTYFLRVPGVGRSPDFRIAPSAAAEAFRVHMGGLYHKRCGVEKGRPYTQWTSAACHREVMRSKFPPDEEDYSTRFFDGDGKTVTVRPFDVVENVLPEAVERLTLPGGWHDAADYDRRPMHLEIVRSLTQLYLLKPENFGDGQLAIPENANGVPDILDEAAWGLRHLLAAQQPDGGVGTWIETTGHPVWGDGPACDDRHVYGLSRATRASSCDYASAAARLARAFGKAGFPAERVRWLASARRAFDFSVTARPGLMFCRAWVKESKSVQEVRWEESPEVPLERRLLALAELATATGEEAYRVQAEALSSEGLRRVKSIAWKLDPLLFIGEGLPAAVRDWWRERVLKDAEARLNDLELNYPYRYPWRAAGGGWVHAMAWGNGHPLRLARVFVAAHALTGKARYREAAALCVDYHNGCNPNGVTWTSGLGRVYPVRFLDLPSSEDGIAEFVPGITPYRNIYFLPERALKAAWDGDREFANRWPILRRWANVEDLTVSASEYTVWETIAPAAVVTGYLADPASARMPPPPPRTPARDLHDLPGFWALP